MKSKSKDLLRMSAVAAAVSFCFTAGMVSAQQADGSLYGRAKSGATVTIVAIETGGSREIKAAADGSFNFAKLPPGRYRVTSGGVTREVNVAIGSGTEILLEGVLEQVTITASRSAIDTRSVESNSVFTQEQIRNLPVGRSTDSVALLAPGTVKGDNFGSGLTLPSFGGASIAENGYYINGLDVTNIRNFLAYAQVPFEGISQTQVKTGGYGAEYGRSLGGVLSVVTKKGTNNWKGGVGLYFEPAGLRSKGLNVVDLDPDRPNSYSVFDAADRNNSLNLTAYVGGPLIKDKLFAFALVDAPSDSVTTYSRDRATVNKYNQPNGMLKLDFQLHERHNLEFTAITTKRKRGITDFDNATAFSTTKDGVGAASQSTGGGDVLIGKYTGYLTDNLTVSALVGRVTEKVNKVTGARTAGEDCPVVLETNLDEIGCWEGPFPGPGAKDPLAPRDADKRNSYRFDVEYNLGAHTLKAGVDNQVFDSSEAGGSSYTQGHYYRYFVVPANGRINGVSGYTPGTQFVRDRILQSTSGVYRVKNSAIYLEDTWRATKNLTLYGGLRWESFDNANGDGVSFVKASNLLAPRFGASWDVTGDSKTKVYGTFGRYYIPVASNTNIRSTRGELFTQRFYTFASRDPVTQGPIGLSAEIGVGQVVSDGSLPNPGTIADTKLKPMNQDELVLGIQKAVAKGLVVGAKIVNRKINDGMDDYCDHKRVADWITQNVSATYSDNLASCMLMNPGRDLNILVDLNDDGNLTPVTIPASALGLAKYSRTYNAIELSVEKPSNGVWSLGGSYTWSKSKGTAEGYVQSNLDQDDAGVTQDFDFGSFTDGANGYLPNDRRHALKFYGTYRLSPEFQLGFNVNVASGRPISCIGFVPPTVSDFSGAGNYTSASAYYCIKDANTGSELVSRGSAGRTPTTTSIDLQLAYVPKWAANKLTLAVDVFNLLNSRKATEVNEVRDYSRDASNATAAPYQVNANYLAVTSYQQPRYVRLTARYEF